MVVSLRYCQAGTKAYAGLGVANGCHRRTTLDGLAWRGPACIKVDARVRELQVVVIARAAALGAYLKACRDWTAESYPDLNPGGGGVECPKRMQLYAAGVLLFG